MVHEVIEIVKFVRRHVEEPVNAQPGATLNPDKRLFHNAAGLSANGGNTPIMPQTTVSARIASMAKAKALGKILHMMRRKMTGTGYYVQLHATKDNDGPQIHLSVQGPRVHQLAAQIHEEWNRKPEPKEGPKR